MKFRYLTLTFLFCAGFAKAEMFFYYTGSIQTFTADATGTYDITAYGGAGGIDTLRNQPGGAGAEIDALFSLNAGETLDIVVGQHGGPGGDAGGGGGGSFVYIDSSGSLGTLLLVAGGGGGAGGEAFGENASLTTAGGNGTGTGGASGGTGGHGGSAFGGCGGAGILSDGGGNGDCTGGSGPPSFAGGSGDNTPIPGIGGSGGYGGGGGGENGGGGGGYSGGGGGGAGTSGAGGGGGSYSMVTPDVSTFSTFSDGEVVITTVTPEPSYFGPIACLAGFALWRGRNNRSAS
jgi:hypothetical protein